MTHAADGKTEFHGPFGRAVEVPIPDIPEAAETVSLWLVTAPAYHPAWSQYIITSVRLRDDVPGFPPPVLAFPGATHELLVVALDPKYQYDIESIRKYMITGRIPMLTPVNICHQHEATDDEIAEMVRLAAWAVTEGGLNPETGDAPERIRENWLAAMTKTLAHMRGEEHAS